MASNESDKIGKAQRIFGIEADKIALVSQPEKAVRGGCNRKVDGNRGTLIRASTDRRPVG
jgi:hypothetical protein